MMRIVLAGAALTCVLTVSAAAQSSTDGGDASAPKQPSLITKPHWIRTPSGSDVAGAYPNAAAAKGQGGKVVMRCISNAAGEMTGCQIVNEVPAGWGFGAASLGLAPKFKIKPMTDDGKSAEGAVVIIPFNWNFN